MYRCSNCGYEFEEPRVEYETHGFDSPPYERVYGCPCCFGDYYEIDEDDYEEE